MIAMRFRSVGWVAGVAAAALVCYLVTQRVAAERAHLGQVEHRILMAKRDIRQLETEIDTRGRLPQLERWNSEVLALSAPGASQFMAGEVQLASLNRPAPPVLDPALAARPAVAQVSYTPSTPRPAAVALPVGLGEPVLRPATYLKPKPDRVTGSIGVARPIALESGDFGAELDRLAAAEIAKSKR